MDLVEELRVGVHTHGVLAESGIFLGHIHRLCLSEDEVHSSMLVMPTNSLYRTRMYHQVHILPTRTFRFQVTESDCSFKLSDEVQDDFVDVLRHLEYRHNCSHGVCCFTISLCVSADKWEHWLQCQPAVCTARTYRWISRSLCPPLHHPSPHRILPPHPWARRGPWQTITQFTYKETIL